jgi:predicted dehydrogenase
MENRPVRIAVAGVGFGATVHIPGLQSEGLDVVAVWSRRKERVEEAAQRFGIPRAFTDYDEMLAMDGLDAVSVVSPAFAHRDMSIAALKAGKHVLCEKPFTTDVAAATEMWQAARDSGLTAMVAHEFRFASGRMRVKELLDEGYVGKPQLVLMRLVQGGGGGGRGGGGGGGGDQVPAYAPERDSAAQGAGFLWGLGSHYIDCLRHWLGEVVSVSGEVRNFRPDRMSGSETVKADADDTFLFTLNFANGAIAHMVGSRSAPFGPGPGVEIYGSEGTLVTPQRGVNPPAHGTVLGARTGDAAGLQELPVPERLQPFADDRDDRLMPFRLMTREFVRGIHEGTPPAPSFYDGLRDQQIMNAVRESSATGRRIDIPPAD